MHQVVRFVGGVVLSLAMASPAFGSAEFEKALTGLADDWDGLLKKHVRADGGVDYQGFNKDFAALESWIGKHAGLKLAGATDNQKLALYINLYNGTMVYNLLKHTKEKKIDVASQKFLKLEINDISVSGGNIWNGNYKVKLAGKDVNLDNIEHGLIRGDQSTPHKEHKVSKLDPRIHAAVNCAAISCPRVREKAYRSSNVQQMLQENMEEWLSTEEQFAKKGSKLRSNKIVFWYYGDFDDQKGGAGDYLSQFVGNKASDAAWKKKHLKENFNDRSTFALRLSSDFEFFYDWKVNDIRNKGSASH